MVSKDGIFTELDSETGEVVKQERLAGAFWTSPMYADGRIYLFNEQGSGYVIQAGKDWKLLETNKLENGCMASPAAVGKNIIVRTKTHVYSLEIKN
jgi:outer membrane protein assembly factor BamB